MELSRDYMRSDAIVDFGSSNFIKLPVKGYLDLLGIDPIAPQIALINAINDPKHRFITAALSRRTGKTFIANVIAQLILLIPNSSVLVISPNYSLSGISWSEQRKLLRKFDIEIVKNNEKDKIIELANGSTLRMGSISQADSVVGRSYDLIVFDECALDPKGQDAFNVQLRPTLDKVNSKAIFISTPRGKNYFWEFFMRGFSEEFPTWASIRSSVQDNPRASREDIEDAKRGMSKAEFEQEYYCSFSVMQGTCWDFDHADIVDSVEGKPVTILAGLDIGFRDPTAMCVIATDYETCWVIDEYMLAEADTSKQAAKINSLVDRYGIDVIYIDSAAAQTRFDLAVLYDITTVNAKKDTLASISYVASLVEHGRLKVLSHCKHTIAALDNYAWDASGVRERPVHNQYSHMADALRYALYSYSINLGGNS
jgi:hypothetical protein